MSNFKPVEKESTDLQLHVDLCAQRYAELDSRLVSLDQKVDAVIDTVTALRADQWKVLITTVGTVLGSVISVLLVILLK